MTYQEEGLNLAFVSRPGYDPELCSGNGSPRGSLEY